MLTSSPDDLDTRMEFLNHLECLVHILEVGKMDGLDSRKGRRKLGTR